MSPDVAKRKMALILEYVKQLEKYRDFSFDRYMKNRFAVERILELLIVTASDLVFHLLSERKEPPPVAYSAAFLRAGETGLITNGLAERLAKAAGMRNVLVHGYETIDHRLVFKSMEKALKDFPELVKQVGKVFEKKKVSSKKTGRLREERPGDLGTGRL
jgi:uncharacterized protein YutE (UPF0331/DUF86 family)